MHFTLIPYSYDEPIITSAVKKLSMESSTVPSVTEWLKGKNILITGATGFLGKVLIEKLLRECPDLGTIYGLLRAKKGKTQLQRLDDIKGSTLFNVYRNLYDWRKVKPIEADFTVSGCGLSEENIRLLQDEVNIVYHIAATVRFDEPLHSAILTNVRITRDMVDLAHGMKNLEIFVHVSTAFSNCNQLTVEEKVYPEPFDWRRAIDLAEDTNQVAIDALTTKVLNDHPNTYTFTKNLAEHVAWASRDRIPVLIYRPAIVTGIKREPEAGWSDNISMAEAVALLVVKGIVRAAYTDRHNRLALCPCDITINGLLAATWKSACHSKITAEKYSPVVNSIYYPFSFQECMDVGKEVMKEHPVPDPIWWDYFVPIKNDRLFFVAHLILNLLPALVFDSIAKVMKKQSPLLKINRKFFVSFTLMLRFFLFTPLTFKTDNYMALLDALSSEDKKRFYLLPLETGEGTICLIRKSTVTTLRLIGERNLPAEVCIKQRRRAYVIDRVCRILLAALFIWVFPYAKCYTTALAAITRILNVLP